MKTLKNRRKIKNTERDFGYLTWIRKQVDSNNKHLEIALRWRNDEEYSYIEIVKKYRESNLIIHYYYNTEYSKSNLRVAKEFFDLLYRSYRYDLGQV